MYFFIWNKSTWEKIVHNKNTQVCQTELYYYLILCIIHTKAVNIIIIKELNVFNNIEFLKIYEE
ncbi:hypothetical protein PFBG_05737 [Plasmodium falciparum 7G8]|uniref:Uncharacterized protein n=1 Tax=Plasmodium falciparum (isolate 7G8) TaxID=57266 RepID=W7F010_PLAF8|nr:hypothetical protein PFBG_05737 [Plasmodium falciparum 7G8]